VTTTRQSVFSRTFSHTNGALTLTMLALCGMPLVAADQPAPGPVPAPELSPADGRRQALAESSYVSGMKARDEARLDDAITDLRRAVDYAPTNETYRKALKGVEALAGLSRDSRSTAIERMTDELSVRQQELKTEALARLDDGVKAMEAGNYTEAERLFQQASVRLDTLPFADPAREPEMRRAETLLKENRVRREKQEREAATKRSQNALDQQQQLRDLSLQIERDRIDAMLKRAQRARDRRDFDEAILLCDQVLKINRAEDRAASLLAKCQRERHAYLRQVTADRWDEEHKLLTEQIRSAMLPQMEIITYSSDWPEIDARRSAPVRGNQGEDQAWRKDIKNQLEQELTLDFEDKDLGEVVSFLQKITNANIVLDPKVLAANPPPITLKVERMKLKYVLDFIMKLTALSYTLRDEAIYISNAEGLRGDVYMKIYDVRDLTHAMQSFPGPELDIPEPGGKGATMLPPIETGDKQETSEFIDIIKKVVAPATWTTAGIDIGEYNGSMVVTQTSEVHQQVDELLRSLRNQKGTQIHVKCKFLTIENSALEQIGVDWNNFTGPSTPPGSGITPIIPIPGAGTKPDGSPVSLGAFYGNQSTNTNAAATVNNSLLNYTSDSSLQSQNPGEGLAFGSQAWSLGNNLYASAILTAVEKGRKGNVIYEPDLTMFNGQQAHLVHMNQQSYVADYDVVQGQYDPVVTVLSYGTVLDVVAIASADKKYITMTLRPTNAQVKQWRRFGGTIPPGSFPGGSIDPNVRPPIGGGDGGFAGTAPLMIPQLSYQSTRTSVTIPDGGSLVIAGMTNGESVRAHAGVPFLSHIPFLGRLFSKNGNQETLLKSMIVVQADVVIFEEIEKNL
jgi:general secretion pathway protein D